LVASKDDPKLGKRFIKGTFTGNVRMSDEGYEEFEISVPGRVVPVVFRYVGEKGMPLFDSEAYPDEYICPVEPRKN
jgi:hypothetical protein